MVCSNFAGVLIVSVALTVSSGCICIHGDCLTADDGSLVAIRRSGGTSGNDDASVAAITRQVATQVFVGLVVTAVLDGLKHNRKPGKLQVMAA